MKYILLTVLAFSFAIQGFAQVAAPSLDPSKPSSLPSVAPWRFYNTAALSYSTAETKDDGNFEGDITAMGGILALNLDGFGMEASSNTFDFEGKDGSFVITGEGTTTQLSLGNRFGELFSLGLGQITNTDNFEGKMSGSLVLEQESETTGMLISANVNLGELLFLGLGINNNKSTGKEGNGQVSTDLQEVEFQELVMGVAVLMGDPGQFQFKAEYSIESNPEVIEDASGSKQTNYVKKTDTNYIILEVKADQYFASYASKTKKEAEIDSKYSDWEEEETTTNIASIGFINDEGLMVTAFSESEKYVQKETDGDKEEKKTTMGVNVGYNF